jgi:hypothetical protein
MIADDLARFQIMVIRGKTTELDRPDLAKY